MTAVKAMTESEKRRLEKAKIVSTDMLFDAIPIGKENAEPSFQIWKRIGLWAPVTIKGKLNRLAAEGRIERLTRSSLKAREAYCYYRSI
jgi:hypothetical protein